MSYDVLAPLLLSFFLSDTFLTTRAAVLFGFRNADSDLRSS